MNLQQRLADRLQGVKWAGKYFYCLCPKHDDHRQSMLVWSNYFKCYGCGFQGHLERLEGYISLAPLRPRTILPSPILPRWRKWEERYGDMDGIVKAAHRNVLDGNWVYFKRRKIDQFIEQGLFGLMDGWIVFPVLDKNREVIDIVVRAIRQQGAKYVVSILNNDVRPLYVPNWERVNKADHIYIVYGIVTAWALEAIELPVVTGITGKSLNPDLLRDFQVPLTVIPDYNEEKDAAKLVNQLGWRGRLKLIDWKNDTTDLDDIRVSYGNEKLMSLVGA